jgi:hypothetical protein
LLGELTATPSARNRITQTGETPVNWQRNGAIEFHLRIYISIFMNYSSLFMMFYFLYQTHWVAVFVALVTNNVPTSSISTIAGGKLG